MKSPLQVWGMIGMHLPVAGFLSGYTWIMLLPSCMCMCATSNCFTRPYLHFALVSSQPTNCVAGKDITADMAIFVAHPVIAAALRQTASGEAPLAVAVMLSQLIQQFGLPPSSSATPAGAFLRRCCIACLTYPSGMNMLCQLAIPGQETCSSFQEIRQ